MNKPSFSVNDEETLRLRRYQKFAQSAERSASANSAVLISRVLYAVLIVGFMGYYLDKALQIIRQQ